MSLSEAEQKVLSDIRKCVESIRILAREDATTIKAGIEALKKLREEIYEDLNQIQHEEMILRAARHLQESDLQGEVVDWYWNPRQTGDKSEPDLRGVQNSSIIISAEITTSERPEGTIDSRMASTLKKLSTMRGRKYYFVRTPAMERRARTKSKKGGYAIEVRKI